MKVSRSLTAEGIRPANRLVFFRRLLCLNLYSMRLCIAYQTAAVSLLFELLHAAGLAMSTWGNTWSLRKTSGSDIGSGLGVLAVLEGKDVSKSLRYNGQ